MNRRRRKVTIDVLSALEDARRSEDRLEVRVLWTAEVTAILIAAGADLNVLDDNGMTALDWAKSSSQTQGRRAAPGAWRT
ncbi:MAG: ankyrin repeat domain-containing protein [Gammaproteobacteria bacterium]|nr:ankyrin repeat domain-containing protein [Gammaproteobacteria bacterium]